MAYLDDNGVTTLTSDIKALTDAAYPANGAVASAYSSSSAYSVGDYCIHGGLLYKCNTAIATGGESWNSSHWTQVAVTDEMLPNTGGTLSGGLVMIGDSENNKITKNLNDVTGQIGVDVPLVSQYGGGEYINDKNGQEVFFSEIVRLTDDTLYRSFCIRRLSSNGTTAIRNGFYLRITSSGTPQVTFTTSCDVAWRRGLGLNYAANDAFSVTDAVLPGYVTSSTKNAYFTITTEKSMEDITSIAVSTCQGTIRGISGYLDNNTTSTDWKTGYTVTATKVNNNTIRLLISKSSAYENTTNNTVLTGLLNLTFTFT